MKRVINKRYEILGVLGRGGMGSVYKVADRLQRGKVLAVKEMRPANFSPDRAKDALNQFRTEANILRRLVHPNLPKFHDYFFQQNAYYIVMEYIHGRTLEQVLDARHGRPVDERLGLSWALQICRAIHFLSVQRPRPIVFRDLKPSNIIIDGSGRIKIVDFGIARFFKDEKVEDTYVYGTPGYAAPEQYGAGQTDVRSDIFSLGATMYHCLTGRNPSENPMKFDEPRRVNPALTREASAIIKKAIEPDMNKRFHDAKEMRSAVQKALWNLSVKGRGVILWVKPGKAIMLPWWTRTSWVSVPVAALGCSGSTGTLSSQDRWIKPRTYSFGPAAVQVLFSVESSLLKSGREYRPRIMVKTDDGILHPQLLLKKRGPWIILGAAAVIAIIGLMAFIK